MPRLTHICLQDSYVTRGPVSLELLMLPLSLNLLTPKPVLNGSVISLLSWPGQKASSSSFPIILKFDTWLSVIPVSTNIKSYPGSSLLYPGWVKPLSFSPKSKQITIFPQPLASPPTIRSQHRNQSKHVTTYKEEPTASLQDRAWGRMTYKAKPESFWKRQEVLYLSCGVFSWVRAVYYVPIKMTFLEAGHQ